VGIREDIKLAIVLGIAGGTGSGKTTVAQAVAGAFMDNSVMVEQDCFYLDRSHIEPDKRKVVNFDHPEAIDLTLLQQCVMQLKNNKKAQLPVYDFTSHTRTKQKRALGPAKIIIVEGILIFHYPQLRNLMDLKVFVQTDADVRLARRIKRDIDERGRILHSVLKQYFNTVKPMHEKYVEPSRYHADIILPEGGFNLLGVETIIAQVARLLRYDGE